MKYLKGYKIFENSIDQTIIEAYLDDLFIELGDDNFIYTILCDGVDEINLVISKSGWREFVYSEIKDVLSHAISYLEENGYSIDNSDHTNQRLVQDLFDGEKSKGLELKFVRK